MLVTLLKSKLHHLRVTQADLEYQGSLTIDEDLMDAVGLLPFEKVLISVLENGNRLETYAIPGPRGSGVCCMNGAAAHKATIGERLIVMAFGAFTPEEAKDFEPQIVLLDRNNCITAPAY
ncbi:MAG: aspartate 1-decarboxylase [Lentisphaerae bacterium]|nr:aspartate 1-decarboxylase [Lentisphaerota bacterium]